MSDCKLRLFVYLCNISDINLLLKKGFVSIISTLSHLKSWSWWILWLVITDCGVSIISSNSA